MQSAQSTPATQPFSSPIAPTSGTSVHAGSTGHPLAHYQIIRRNGAVVPFEPDKIAVAMMKAFLAVHGT
jgi:ribonucleoside-diphosphate reductase alpha chain